MNDKAIQVLQSYWGFDHFRPLQGEIVEAALDGNDILAILPTGGGKSICFQVPAMLKPGICLVISPLIALMKDQVENLNERGIPALALNSVMSFREMEQTLRQAAFGSYKFLYVSPERLQTRLFREYLPALSINLIAVDEAHCISQWGYDFRPAYLKIAELRQEKPGIPMMALTASATPSVQEDILEKLLLSEPLSFRQSFARPNLCYHVNRVPSKINLLTEILQGDSGSAIVYCRSRRITVEISNILNLHGISSDYYHAGLSSEARNQKQSDWIDNKIRVMVCTNAFGMGIDKPDVRSVIHLDAPDCIENYYQEAGRAGRDGKDSRAFLIESITPPSTLEKELAIRFPDANMLKKIYQDLSNYFQLPTGIGEDRFFEFDLTEFSRRFNHSPLLLTYALQALQQEEMLSYHEQIFLPSTIQVIASRETMNEFEERAPELSLLFKTLLRSYGGILDRPVPISEKQLGFLVRKKKEDIRTELGQLTAHGLIMYHPQKEKPLIRFLQNRVKSDDLMFNHENYEKRKNAFIHRWKAMQEYLATSSCRAKFIARYFGDATSEECGACDNCRSNQKKRVPTTDFKLIHKKISAFLSEGSKSYFEILESLKDFSEENVKVVLDFLVNENYLERGKDGRLVYKKNGPG